MLNACALPGMGEATATITLRVMKQRIGKLANSNPTMPGRNTHSAVGISNTF